MPRHAPAEDFDEDPEAPTAADSRRFGSAPDEPDYDDHVFDDAPRSPWEERRRRARSKRLRNALIVAVLVAIVLLPFVSRLF